MSTTAYLLAREAEAAETLDELRAVVVQALDHLAETGRA